MANGHNDKYSLSDPDKQEAATSIRELAAAAPPEIRADMRTLAAIVEALAKGSSDIPDAAAASTRVASYLRDVCHLAPKA